MMVEVSVSLDLSIFFEAHAARSLGEATAAIVKWLALCVRRKANWSGHNIFIFSVTFVFSNWSLAGDGKTVLTGNLMAWKEKFPEKKFSDRHINQTLGVLCSTGLIFTFIPKRIVAFDLCEEFKQLRASLSLSAIIKWFLNSHSQIPSIIIDTREIKYLFSFSSSAHILTTH